MYAYFTGGQTTMPTFGSSDFGQFAFGGQRGGSRVYAYSPTPEIDGATGTQPTGKLESISAMPVYKDKSDEELRWEDHQLGDKGGPAPAGQAMASVSFGSLGFKASSTPPFGQSSGNPFSSSTSSNPFTSKAPVFSAFGSSPFGTSNTSSVFGSTSSLFGATTQAFGVNTSPSLFSSSSSSAFGPPSIFGATSAPGTTAFGATSTPAFSFKTTPEFGTTSDGFGALSSPSGSTTPVFSVSSTPAFGATSAPAFNSATPAFSATSFPSFKFGSSPAVGQSTSAFGISPFGTRSSFGTQSASFGEQTAMPPFGSLGFAQFATGRRREGSRVYPYSHTPEPDGVTGTQLAGKLRSISAMLVYKDKIHEELRWEDYQLGDRVQPTGKLESISAMPANKDKVHELGWEDSQKGALTSTPMFGRLGFGQSTFGGQQGMSRVFPCTPAPQIDDATCTLPTGIIESISAMLVYRDKSHEELRWEDHQLGDKGGPTTLSTFGNSGYGQSAFGKRCRGSRISCYSPTPETDGGTVTRPAANVGPISVTGGQTTSSTLGNSGDGQSVFGKQRGGSRVSGYSPTPEIDGGATVTQPTQPATNMEGDTVTQPAQSATNIEGATVTQPTQPATNIESSSAMLVSKDMNHDEEHDYVLVDKDDALGSLCGLIQSLDVKSSCTKVFEFVKLISRTKLSSFGGILQDKSHGSHQG